MDALVAVLYFSSERNSVPQLQLKAGDARQIQFQLRNTDGSAINLVPGYEEDPATFQFVVKESKRWTETILDIADADFDKSDIANGNVTLALVADNTELLSGTYVGELYVTVPDGQLVHSEDIAVIIDGPVRSAS